MCLCIYVHNISAANVLNISAANVLNGYEATSTCLECVPRPCRHLEMGRLQRPSSSYQPPPRLLKSLYLTDYTAEGEGSGDAVEIPPPRHPRRGHRQRPIAIVLVLCEDDLHHRHNEACGEQDGDPRGRRPRSVLW